MWWKKLRQESQNTKRTVTGSGLITGAKGQRRMAAWTRVYKLRRKVRQQTNIRERSERNGQERPMGIKEWMKERERSETGRPCLWGNEPRGTRDADKAAHCSHKAEQREEVHHGSVSVVPPLAPCWKTHNGTYAQIKMQTHTPSCNNEGHDYDTDLCCDLLGWEAKLLKNYATPGFVFLLPTFYLFMLTKTKPDTESIK